MESRGIRNNNPGNVRKSATRWQGLADQQPDPAFCTFKSPEYGLRTIAKILLTYQNQDHLHTVRGMISRWAPSVENNTEAYIAAICAALHVHPDDEADADTAAVMCPLVRAIVVHENGSCPYTDGTIAEGVRLAGVADAKPPALVKQNAFLAQAGSGVAIVAAGGTQLAQYAPTVKDAADRLSDYTGSPIIQHAVTFLITVAGALTVVGLVADWMKHRST